MHTRWMLWVIPVFMLLSCETGPMNSPGDQKILGLWEPIRIEEFQKNSSIIDSQYYAADDYVFYQFSADSFYYIERRYDSSCYYRGRAAINLDGAKFDLAGFECPYYFVSDTLVIKWTTEASRDAKSYCVKVTQLPGSICVQQDSVPPIIDSLPSH